MKKISNKIISTDVLLSSPALRSERIKLRNDFILFVFHEAPEQPLCVTVSHLKYFQSNPKKCFFISPGIMAVN